jgi:4-hydroxy-2-oxoheptanedioate aldolase
MTGFECKKALGEGQTICGTLIVSPSPKWLKYIEKCGLDFVFIDTEHVALGAANLASMCTMYAARNLAPVVRILSPDPFLATQALDAGAHGILVPYVETAEQVRRLVGAVHYKPIKGKLLEQALAHPDLLDEKIRRRLTEANKHNILFVNIESRAGIEALDEILSVDGLDGIVIGPNDLSYSLGDPDNYDSEIFEETVVGILKKARAKGIAAGIHYMGGIERQIQWAKKTGMNLLFHSGDMYIFVESLRKDLLSFRQELRFDHEDRGEIKVVI